MKTKTQCVHIDPELIKLADDLVAAIHKANWALPLRGPTPHMGVAVAGYLDYKDKNHV